MDQCWREAGEEDLVHHVDTNGNNCQKEAGGEDKVYHVDTNGYQFTNYR